MLQLYRRSGTTPWRMSRRGCGGAPAGAQLSILLYCSVWFRPLMVQLMQTRCIHSCLLTKELLRWLCRPWCRPTCSATGHHQVRITCTDLQSFSQTLPVPESLKRWPYRLGTGHTKGGLRPRPGGCSDSALSRVPVLHAPPSEAGCPQLNCSGECQ